MDDMLKRYDSNRWQAMRAKAHRIKKQRGIKFEEAFDLVAQQDGFRDRLHATHWLIPSAWWGPCDPPTKPGD